MSGDTLAICPRLIPVFPVSGVLLLPGGRLPLHVFEPRYRDLVEDAIEGDGFVGMIQPLASGADKIQGAGDDVPAAAELYSVGCAGVIERWQRVSDDRFIILLKGIARFRIRREVEAGHAYRLVEADYRGFAVDLDDAQAEVPPDRLMEALRSFGKTYQLSLELEKLDELSGLALLNSIAMSLPFQPAEKQALLEAPDVGERLEMLLALMHMGIELRSDVPPPVLN